MTEFRPDTWVVLRMKYRDQVIYKVLGGWSNKTVQESNWRLNSGITKAEYNVEYDLWYFYGSSGTIFIVNPNNYGLRDSISEIYQTMIKTYPDQVELLDDCNWDEMCWI